jgi:signal recognition particle receptor subunit beta
MPKLNLQRIKDILAKKQLDEMEEDMVEEEGDDEELKNVMSKRYPGKNPERKKEFDAAKKKVAMMIKKKLI